MADKPNFRVPTQAEREAGTKAQDRFCEELTPGLSNIELGALGSAFLRELAARDGVEAATAWCSHWADKLRQHNGRRYDA